MTTTKAPRKRAASRKKRRATEPWHGTVNGYSNRGCRCEACKNAWSVYMAEYRARRFGQEPPQCTRKRCKNPQSIAAGNGLCYTHNEEENG